MLHCINRISYFEPMMGIEPMTSSLPRKRSTPELHRRERAGDEARTRDPNLGRVMLYQLSYSRMCAIPQKRHVQQYIPLLRT